MDKINTILLTGATGYLGSNLIPALLQNHYNVCIVKRPTSSLNMIKDHVGQIKIYDNTERDIEQLFFDNKIDLIIHTATSYGRKNETFLQIKEANLDFPAALLQAALINKVGFFISTGTSLPVFANTYALLKNQFAQCLELFSSSIVSINIILEHFYGPGDDLSKFISGMINKMLANEPEINLTAGTQLRDFIYIDDVVSAYINLIKNLSQFKGYNVVPVGSGTVVSIREIVELIKKYSDSQSQLNFGAIAMRENELMKSNADISKLNNLGWKPSYNLHDGLKLTIKDMLN